MRVPFPTLPLAVLALTAPLAACGEQRGSAPPDSPAAAVVAADAPLGPGEARLAVDGGRIWYKTSGAASGAPVILLHGGPGFASYYMKAFEALGDERPVVRYDQLGAGKSDRLTDTAMFNIAHFVRELEALRAHLGHDRVHLVGHSWGTILALEYYRAHPGRVASLTLASPALDIPTWERNARRLVGTLSDSAQRAIRTREAEGKFDAPDYQAALAEFYGKYVWRTPNEADLDSTLKTANEAIYNYMQGPSEFTITGTLKRYDSTPFLKGVKVPTLYMVGEFDEADPPTVRRFADMTPGARFVEIPGAAHLIEWDNPEASVRAVREFLKGVDAGSAVARR
jgi:proline-specific peptidase